MKRTDKSKIKLLLFLVLILFIMPRSGVAQEPKSLFSEWKKLLKDLELNPSSEKIKEEIKEIREIMLVPLTPENVKGDSSLHLETHNKFFNTATFPKEGIVSKDKAFVYNNLLLKIKELSKGTRLKLAGVYPFAFRNDDTATGIYHYFYKIRTESTEIISTNDVAIEEKVINPPYISPDKKVRVLKTPVSYFYEGEPPPYTEKKYKLWLKKEDAKLIFLNDYYSITQDAMGDYPQSSYKFDHPVSWSPDSKYLFIECAGKVFSQNGGLIFYNKKHYTSPFWHGGYLYMRGIEEDDNVYRLNLETQELKKFLEYSQGEKVTSETYDRNKECRMISKPIRFENDSFIVNFYRINPKSTNLDNGCMEIRITADMKGAVIKKDTLIKSCIK